MWVPVKSIYCSHAGNNTSSFNKFFLKLLRGVPKCECLAANIINWRRTIHRQKQVIIKFQFPWLLFVFKIDFNWKIKTSISCFCYSVWGLLQNCKNDKIFTSAESLLVWTGRDKNNTSRDNWFPGVQRKWHFWNSWLRKTEGYH